MQAAVVLAIRTDRIEREALAFVFDPIDKVFARIGIDAQPREVGRLQGVEVFREFPFGRAVGQKVTYQVRPGSTGDGPLVHFARPSQRRQERLQERILGRQRNLFQDAF